MGIKKTIKSCVGRLFPITYSKILFRIRQGYKLNLKNPTGFNEKLMYLKINDYYKNKTVWKCSDKMLVREYAISKGINEENLPALLGVYDDANKIDYESLPNKFALKCSHGCGFNIICVDKNSLDIKKTNKQLNKWLKTKFGYASAENHYTHIKPCIIVEEYIDSNKGLPYDYKLYCFYGKPMLVLVCSAREKELKLNYYDLNWNELPYGKEEYRNKEKIKKPSTLNEMIKIAKIVSKEFPFVRVDFYEYKNKAILGEMTFTPAQCTATYYSKEGEKELAKLLKLKKGRKYE